MDPEELPAAPRDEAWRRRLAGFVLHAQLAGRTIPEHVPGLPDRMLADRIGRMDAKAVLGTLQDIYGVAWWTREEFERVFVDGALAGWRPGSLVQRSPGRLRVVSATCPIGAEAEKDPRLCEVCRALQTHAAYVALVGQVADVRFRRLMSRGEGACELEVAYRDGRPDGGKP